MLRRILLLGLLILVAGPVLADVPVVRIVGPDGVAADISARLAARLPGIEWRRETPRDDRQGDRQNSNRPQLVIAVGAGAFVDAATAQRNAMDTTPLLGVALTRQAYRQVPAGRHSAIFWEPNPVAQLRLARVFLPGARRVGVVVGERDEALLAALRTESQRLGLELVVGVVAPNETLTRRLNAVLADSDFLLGIDDPAVFTPALAKTVLMTSYRHGKPVFGPTASWVSAGSVASLNSDMSALVDALVTTIPALLVKGELPAPRYLDMKNPGAGNVSTNASVARSLQLSLPPQSRLDSMLRDEGAKP